MLPLALLNTAQGHPMLVELKNGETYNGHLDGDRFWRLPEAYVRGNTIKYLRIPEEVIALVKDQNKRSAPGGGGAYLPGGRGRGRGGRGGQGGDYAKRGRGGA